MPLFTPPAGDAVDFELELFTPPAGDEVDFELDAVVHSIDLEVELVAGIATVTVVGTVDLEIDFAELPAPPVLDFEFTGTIDLEVEVEAIVRTFTAVSPGESTVDVYNPNGVLQGTLTPLRYRISRYANQVGDWECELPVDEEVDEEGASLASKIEYGWKISITQENFSPDHGAGSGHLLYQGIVEERSFPITQGGQTRLVLKGSFRTYAVVRRSVLQNLEYDGPLSTLTALLVGDLLNPYGATYDANAINVHVKGTFNDLSRYAAWLRAAELGRRTVRETWDHDRPELVRYDGPPDSGITFRPLNAEEERYQHDNGTTGVALIAGTPLIRWDGTNVVNRIVPIGVDTVDDESVDLTLQWATLASPYTVKAGLNPDGTLFFYIEDEESIERFGLTEVKLVFSDVKNPNDLLASRQRAANVLYMRAVNQLIKRRSPKIEVSLPPLANGASIWALPGDQSLLTYQGVVQTESGDATWMDIEARKFLITERHEESHPSGIRRVGYKLAAPEMEFPVPGLPGEITFPPEGPGNDPNDPSNPDPPGSEPCCEDPNNGQEEGPDDEWEQTFPTPEGQCIVVGNRDLFVLSINAGVPWDHVISSSGGVTVVQPPPETFSIALPDLGAGTWTVNASVHYHVSVIAGGGFAVLINDGELASFGQSFSETGDNSIIDEEGATVIPVVAASFEAGEVASVRVSIKRTSGDGFVDFIYGDSYLELCFTPAP